MSPGILLTADWTRQDLAQELRLEGSGGACRPYSLIVCVDEEVEKYCMIVGNVVSLFRAKK